MAQELQVTSAAERRRKGTYLFKASDNLTIRLRRMSMPNLLLNNLMPMPLLNAAIEYERIQKGGDPGKPTTAEEARELVEKTPELLTQWNEFLKRYVCVVAVEPRVVMGVSTDPAVLSADELDSDELLAILNAKHPDEQEAEAPLLNEGQAEEFRGSAQPPADPPVEDVKVTRIETFVVDTPEREAIHA